VSFLLDTFRIPADTFFLFVATSVINSRFGTLVAAVHTVAIAVIGTAAVLGAVTIDSRRLLRYVAMTAVLTAATLGGLRPIFSTVLRAEFKGREMVLGLQPRFPLLRRSCIPHLPCRRHALPRSDQDWAALVNTWIELKRRDGTIDELYRHWILGQTAQHRTGRWSILRNVLHWTE
jgi:hypothetical protein